LGGTEGEKKNLGRKCEGIVIFRELPEETKETVLGKQLERGGRRENAVRIFFSGPKIKSTRTTWWAGES